jgi:hypothetical protein
VPQQSIPDLCSIPDYVPQQAMLTYHWPFKGSGLSREVYLPN